MAKLKQWFVFVKGDKFYAIEDKGVKPKGVKIVGNPAFQHPEDAIDYVRDVMTGGGIFGRNYDY
jgi:hypothetical protein